MAGREQQGPGEPAEQQLRQFGRREPGHLADLAVIDRRSPGHDRRFVHGGDVGGPVAVRVLDLEVRATDDIEQPEQPNFDADLLVGFAHGRLGRGLTDLDGTPDDAPLIAETGMPHQQQPPGLVDRQNRSRRQQ